MSCATQSADWRLPLWPNARARKKQNTINTIKEYSGELNVERPAYFRPPLAAAKAASPITTSGHFLLHSLAPPPHIKPALLGFDKGI